MTTIEGHKKILKAIEESDPETLARAMSFRLEESKQNTLRYAFQEEVDEEEKKG